MWLHSSLLVRPGTCVWGLACASMSDEVSGFQVQHAPKWPVRRRIPVLNTNDQQTASIGKAAHQSIMGVHGIQEPAPAMKVEHDRQAALGL